MAILYFLIAICASTIGAISGIGGGIIIKPVMDAMGGLSSETISFMSGCTVLAMAISSYIRGRKSKIEVNYATTIWLAIGAAIGGVLGKSLFSLVDGPNIGLIQSIILFIINLGVFIYLRVNQDLPTLNVKNPGLCTIIGLSLGIVSSFLGIGGGPINIAVLYYFFSMSPKVTAKNSLFIILFSQFTSFTTTMITGVPVFDPLSLTVMCIGGVGGAIIGAMFSKKMSEQTVENFFSVILIGLILLNVYNIVFAII